jgi:hypothetical protein
VLHAPSAVTIANKAVANACVETIGLAI